MSLLGALRRLDEGRYRAELYRVWSTGLAAGLAHAASLEQAGRIDSVATEELRRYLIVGAQQGRAVGALVKARPKLFEPFEAAILAAGDEAGTLETSLRILADQYSREYRRMLAIRMMMGYPVFLGVIAAFVFTLPFLHRGWRPYVIAVVVAQMAFLLLGGVFLSIFASIVSAGAAFALPRFVRALVVGVEAGLPLGRTVRLAVDVSQSSALRVHIAKRTERELSTTPLAELFEGCRLIPPGLIGQMRVADVSGDFRSTLRKFAEQLEEKG